MVFLKIHVCFCFIHIFTIRVPAEKHPKIAPTEFAKFIEAQGANLPVKRATSLQRRNSVLAQSYTLEDDTNELARITFQKRKDDLRESANEGRFY